MDQVKSRGPAPSRDRNPKADSKSVAVTGVASRVIQAVKERGQLLDIWKGKPISWPEKNLTGWLLRELTGNDVDLRSPIYRKVSREEVLAGFDPIFDERMASVPANLREILTDHEMGQRANISEQSTFVGWIEDGPEKVRAVYSDKPMLPELDRQVMEEVIHEISSWIPAGSIRCVAPRDAVRRVEGKNPLAIDDEGMDTTTNAGLPTVNSSWYPSESLPPPKRAKAEISWAVILERVSKAIADYKAGRPVEWWAIAAKRLAQKKDPAKRKRLVIALEKAEAVLWKTFTPQLQRELRELKCPGGVRPFVAWTDLPGIDQDMQLMLDVAARNGRKVVSGDVSAFDASLPPWLITKVGELMEPWVYQAGYLVRGLTDSLANRVNLVTPNKIWEGCPSSMKSGSGGTNLIDTLAILSIIKYGEAIGLYKLENYAAQGDDFVLDGPGVSPEAIATVFAAFGMDAHPSKQMYEDDALLYLQRVHYRGWIGGISSVYRTLGSALSYERLRYRAGEWSAYTDIVRAISQLENCVFSPVFEGLVDYLRRGDRYDLGAKIHPSEVLVRSGDAGRDVVNRDNNAAWKSGTTVNGFTQNAVNGVLRGETLPPLGSRERFLRAYGAERIAVSGL